MLNPFNITLYGKCIVSGEHAVLRNHPAIIFPIKAKSLTLTYTSKISPLCIKFLDNSIDATEELIWKTIERALDLLTIKKTDLTGILSIQNTILIGAGMGASAAFCVAIGNWLHNLGFILKDELFEFAKQLENLFHGESSGADIAAVIAGKPIQFSKQNGFQIIQPIWQPKWYLSFSSKQSRTIDCVIKVKKQWQVDPIAAEKIDEQMATAVALTKDALLMTDSSYALEQLTKAIQLGYECFQKWGLCDETTEQHITMLKKAGALAAKPSGAGAGGYVLSLWNCQPPQHLLKELIGL